MPPIIDAVKAYATVGEISDAPAEPRSASTAS